jgi:hypothetical protein
MARVRSLPLLLGVLLLAPSLAGASEPLGSLPAPPPPRSGPAPAATNGGAWGGYIGSIESQVRRALARTHVRVERVTSPTAPQPHEPGGVGGTSGAAPREPSAGLGLPRELALGPAIPNPSARSVTLRLDLPEPAWVRFSILDVAGRLIEESSERRPAGRSSLVWPAREAAARVVPGIYFARVTVNGRVLPTRRWVVIP